MLQEDCWRGRAAAKTAGAALGFAAVSAMGAGDSVYVDVIRSPANMSVPRSSLAIASCGLRHAVCAVEKQGTDSQGRVCCYSLVSCQDIRGVVLSAASLDCLLTSPRMWQPL